MSHNGTYARDRWPQVLAVALTMVVMVWVLAPIRTNQEVKLTPADSQSYEKSIEQGLAYLSHNPEQVAAFQWLILDYLQRRFGLDPQFGATKRDLAPPTNLQEALELKAHRRIAFPDEIVSSLPIEDATPMQQMVTIASNCDHSGLPSNFEDLLRSNMRAGGYSLTHVAYSLERMKDNGCLLPASSEQELRQKVARQMVAVINAPDTTADLRYEAIAFLMHMGRPDLVKKRWMTQIVYEQQTDGGWKVSSQDASTSDHPTVLALWALLEYSRSPTSAEPLLRRPSQL